MASRRAKVGFRMISSTNNATHVGISQDMASAYYIAGASPFTFFSLLGKSHANLNRKWTQCWMKTSQKEKNQGKNRTCHTSSVVVAAVDFARTSNWLSAVRRRLHFHLVTVRHARHKRISFGSTVPVATFHLDRLSVFLFSSSFLLAKVKRWKCLGDRTKLRIDPVSCSVVFFCHSIEMIYSTWNLAQVLLADSKLRINGH